MSDLISKEKTRYDIAILIMNNNSLIDRWLANCIDDIIDEQPTIEAIPVEWVEKQKRKCVPHSITWLCLKELLVAWKENEHETD